VFTYFASSREETMFPVETKLADLLRAKYGEKFRDFYLKITRPVKEDLLLAEKYAWLEVARQPSLEKFRQHALKYPFQFFCIYSWEKAIEILSQRAKLTNVENLENEIKEQQAKLQSLVREQEKLFAEINNEEIESLARFIQEQALLRFELKACWGGNDFYLLDFYKEVSKRTMLPLVDLAYYCIPTDFFDFLEKGIEIKQTELKKRKQHCILHIYGGKMDVYSGEAALAKKREFLDSSLPSKETREIKGLIANMGKVSGHVKLLKVDNAEEILKLAADMQDGVILVTGMTNPTMVPLFKKVKGIVTDEGGMACHAAIISRELNVPCVVGCRIATRVLSDGDYIELDADNGIIRKLDGV
ncbi:MAG: PEP-utilizing enzyme, partial [Candidatus Micrarchaeota archaeon]|nr:PEP-utilizing enzyme [Candidatus Micrarchaeota archaeon]